MTSRDSIATLPTPDPSQWQTVPATLLPPVPPPEKIVCIGLNYRDHAIETGSEIPTEPVVFSKFNTAMIGHGDVIRLPKVAHEVDYEAELVVVIGKPAKHVAAGDAMKHVYGYSCGHDVSAATGKRGARGPMVTWQDVRHLCTNRSVRRLCAQNSPIPANLRVRMHLNGEVVQDSSTDQLIFDIPTLISHLSQIVTLRPGDLIFTGTPPGVGAARRPPVFLKPGDECSVEIEGIGSLCNRCESEE